MQPFLYLINLLLGGRVRVHKMLNLCGYVFLPLHGTVPHGLLCCPLAHVPVKL